MDKSEKLTFSFTLLLVIVIIVSCLIIFVLTPSPLSPTKTYFGYIKNLYSKGNSLNLDFDRANWYQDTATDFPASNACYKARNEKCNKCSLPITKSCLSDGYFINNPDTKISTFNLLSSAMIGTLIFNENWNEKDPKSTPYKTIKTSEFSQIFQNPNHPDHWIVNAPYDITVIGNKIIKISQHYIP